VATTRQGTKMITMAPEAEELVTQPKRPEGGRFRLQVDRQTKESYTTCEAAEAAGMEIKKAYAVLQLLYDGRRARNRMSGPCDRCCRRPGSA